MLGSEREGTKGCWDVKGGRWRLYGSRRCTGSIGLPGCFDARKNGSTSFRGAG
jgi:hypothetical protein